VAYFNEVVELKISRHIIFFYLDHRPNKTGYAGKWIYIHRR